MKALSTEDAELLHRYLDGEVSEAERASFETRLQEDAELRRRWEAGRELGGLLRAYAARGLDDGAAQLEGLAERIQDALEPGSTTALMSRRRGTAVRGPEAKPAERDQRTRALRRRRTVVWSAAALAVCAAAALVVVLGPFRGGKSSDVARAPETGGGVQSVAQAASNQADIEELDVPSSAAVFTIPDDQGDKSTTVIWVSDPEPSSGSQGDQGP